MELASQHAGNKEAIKVIYSSLLMVAKIFNSLNSQDIPEYFEDNMAVWMTNFHTLLVTENPLLKTGVKLSSFELKKQYSFYFDSDT